MRTLDNVAFAPLGPCDLVSFAQTIALCAEVFGTTPSWIAAQQAPSVWLARAPIGGTFPSLAGFAATQVRVRERYLELVGLAVAPPWRRAGVGRRLVEIVVDRARAARLPHVSLHVSTGNLAAIRLYEDAGFIRRRRLPRYYSSPGFPDGGDAWWMTR